MASWRVLDPEEHPEAYKPTVCLDDVNSNFSITVGAVLEAEAETSRSPVVKSFVRRPYVAVAVDGAVCILNTTDGAVRLLRSGAAPVVPVAGLIIRERRNAAVVCQEDGQIIEVDLETGSERRAQIDLPRETFVLARLVEKDDETIVLVNAKSTIFPNYLLTLHHEENASKHYITPIKDENLNNDTLIEIEMMRTGRTKMYDSLMFFKASSDGNIEIFCPLTHQNCIIPCESNILNVKTFEDCPKLITFSESSRGECNLSILNFFGMHPEFHITVGRDCHSIGATGDFLLYAELKNKKVFIYTVKQISPICQLEMLIALQNYEGAEQFAKANQLSPAAIIEIKAKCLLQCLKKTFTPEGLDELIKILSSHDSAEFIVNTSCDGVKSNILLYPLLEFAKGKLLNTNCEKSNRKIDDLIWRAEAFRLLQYDTDDLSLYWSDFANDSAINLCKRFIVDDMLDCATIVWIKSYRSIVSTLKVRDVADLLCSISLDTKLDSLLKWLEYFLPTVNSVLPYSADLIITWAKDRICVLENSIRWPKVGIQFAEKFSSLMFNSPGLISYIPQSTEKVYYLINCMYQIQTLKNEYNIPISLRDFTTLNGNELAKLILRKSFTEDLECLLKKFLDNFIIKHSLNHDSLIHEYIEEMISLSPSIDETRMDILLNSIYNADEKYLCVILVIKSATIPWSKEIRRIADNAINSKHVLVPKIQIEIIHSDIRALLMKYKCYDLDPDDFEYLIEIIIKKGNPEMMADIEKVTNVYTRLKEDAYLLCIQNYIKQNNIQKALDVFNKIEKAYKIQCIETLTMVLENQLSCNNVNKQLEYDYLDFLKSTKEADERTLVSLNNIFVLKNRFMVKIPLSEYCIEAYRMFAFINWYKEKSECMNHSNFNGKNILVQSFQVGRYLLLSKTDCISLILKHTSDGNLLSKLANIIISDRSNFIEKNVKSLDLILKMVPLINIADIILLENCLSYIYDIMSVCSSKYLSYCIDAASWLLSIYQAHNNVREVLNMWTISPIYNPHIINSIIPIWREILQRNSIENYITKTISVCLCNGDVRCIDGSSCLRIWLTKFQSQQNDVHFIRLIAYCCNLFMNKEMDIPNWLVDLNDCTVNVLLSKMINTECLDHLLISILLFSYSNPGDWLNNILKGSIHRNKKINVAHHILQCRDIYHHVNVPYAQAFTLYSQNIIENKLEYNGIALKSDDEGSYDLPALLESFIHTKTCNFGILEEFCTVANINLDQTLIYYLFYLLKWWNDDYVFAYDNFGNCTIRPSESQRMIMEQCTTILNKIKQKEQLVKDLTLLFRNGEINIANLSTINLNLYCYEAYIFILDLLKSITGSCVFLREYMLLKFLQSYQRVTKPAQSELDEFSMKEHFPKIGFYRLPFSYVMCDNFWNNLKPEVTLATYKQWLSISGLLMLNPDIQVTRDMICSNAVKQSMTMEKKINEGSDMKWTLHMRNDRLLKEAHECIQHITNLEWAGACFYYVYQGSAMGADQVAAIDMCYQFAEHWAKVEPNHNNVKKMQIKHLLTSTAHVLHKIGLAEDKLLALCDNPHRLIEALYNHHSIISKYENPNINNAVDEIAEKHNLNAGALRMRMLEKILNINNVPSSDLSMNKSISITDGSLSKDLLMKACYILKGINQTMATIYLSRIGLGNGDINPNNGLNSNVRALQCLLSLADCEVIENVTSYKLSDLWGKLWELYFMNGLNIIGVEYLIPMFHEDKAQIIQQLWHARHHNHLVITFVIKMMIIYNIQIDDSLLDNIIATINKFDMIYEVKNFLLSIKVTYGANYVDMWTRVLLTPFKRLEAPLTDHQKDECFQSLKMLPFCPIVSRIDLSMMWQNCLKVGAIEMAVVFLPHLNEAGSKTMIEKIGKIKKSTLQDLKEMKAKGILTTNCILNVLKYQLKK